jgi:hypothetical protein
MPDRCGDVFVALAVVTQDCDDQPGSHRCCGVSWMLACLEGLMLGRAGSLRPYEAAVESAIMAAIRSGALGEPAKLISPLHLPFHSETIPRHLVGTVCVGDALLETPTAIEGWSFPRRCLARWYTS